MTEDFDFPDPETLSTVMLESLLEQTIEELKAYSPRELAVCFVKGSEPARILYRRYVSQQSLEFQEAYRSALDASSEIDVDPEEMFI